MPKYVTDKPGRISGYRLEKVYAYGVVADIAALLSTHTLRIGRRRYPLLEPKGPWVSFVRLRRTQLYRHPQMLEDAAVILRESLAKVAKWPVKQRRNVLSALVASIDSDLAQHVGCGLTSNSETETS